MKQYRTTTTATATAIAIAALTLSAGTMSCAPNADVDVRADEVAAITVQPATDITGATLDSLQITMRSAGYRPLSISAHGTTADPRYTAVFVKRTGADWRLVRGTGLSSFQSAFTTQAQAGYKPTMLSFDGAADSPVWAAVFVQTSTGIPYTRHALIDGAADNSQTIQYWIAKARNEGLIPSAVSMYGTSADRRYALVLEPNPNNVDWSLDGIADSAAQYQARWTAQTPARNRPALVDINSSQQYVSLYRDDMLPVIVGAHGLTLAQLNSAIDTNDAAGRVPIMISGGGSGAATRFAVVFSTTDTPAARVWSAQGTTTTVPAIDNLLRDYMQRYDVRQAQLAVLNGRRLVYTRGYTLAEPGYPIANAETRFRTASVSKTVTAMQIMQLVDRGELTLDTTVQSVLNLTDSNGNVPGNGFAGVTIRHLLSHTYPTIAAVTPNTPCLRRDSIVDQSAASALGVSLPLTTSQAVRYSLAQSVNGGTPTSGCYSNFGYTLLGMVIERRRQLPFAQALYAGMFSGLGMTHTRIAEWNVLAQPTNEAFYRSNHLAIHGSNNEPGSPWRSHAYGAGNFQVLAAAGGISMAAMDLTRLFAMLNVTSNNPVYQNTFSDDGSPTTISTLINNSFGFDGSMWVGSSRRYFKGGSMSGTQSIGSYSPGGMSYVLFWARDGLGAVTPADDWYPNWDALVTAINATDWSSTPDQFPNYAMPSL